MSIHSPIDVTVDTRIFADNLKLIKDYVAPAQLCTVLKSNAYGHGLKELAPIAVAMGSDYLGICTNPEAAAIRTLGLDVKLMRLRFGLPEEYEQSAQSLTIEEQVGTWEAAEILAQLGRDRGQPMAVHINIDTGMGRSGFFPEELDMIKRVCGLDGLEIKGIMTHFANADGEDLRQTDHQLAQFNQVIAELGDDLPPTALIHTFNSAATMRMTSDRPQLCRLGAACYGVRTSQHFANIPGLKPVMAVKTKVAAVRKVPAGRTIGYGSLFTTQRPSLIASLPVGFGEGYPRSLFNKGIVLIHGQRCPVVGRVSLNITTVDITDLKEPVMVGEEVILVGAQGQEEVTFEELADLFHSVHTEINLMAGFMNEIRYL